MKNIGLLIAGLFWIQTLSAPIQSTEKRFLGGIVAGLNLSQIDGDAESWFQ